MSKCGKSKLRIDKQNLFVINISKNFCHVKCFLKNFKKKLNFQKLNIKKTLLIIFWEDKDQ